MLAPTRRAVTHSAANNAAEAEHQRHPEPGGEDGDLQHPAEGVAPGAAEQPGDEQARRRGRRTTRARVSPPAAAAPSERRDRSLATRPAKRTTKASSASDARGEGPPGCAHGTCLPHLNSVRTSAAIVIEPVASTPPPAAPSGLGDPDASSSASSSRCGHVHPVLAEDLLGELAELLGGIARGDDDRVTTISSSIGSSASRMPSASLSASTPTTPTSRVKVNASCTASARTAAPAGLCAASTRTVGLRRTTSSRPGESTPANAGPDDVAGRAGAAAPSRTEERLDRGQRAGGVVRLVRAVQREEHVLVACRPSPRRRDQLAADGDVAVHDPELQPLAGHAGPDLAGPPQQHLGGLDRLLGEHRGRALLDDPGLLAGDRRDVVPEEALVVDARSA